MVFVEPFHRAARCVEPVGAAAGKDDGVDDLDVVGRVEEVRLERPRRAAAHVAAADRPFRREDHGAAGRPLRQREVADLDAVDRRQRHVVRSRPRRLPRGDYSGRRRQRDCGEQHRLHAASL